MIPAPASTADSLTTGTVNISASSRALEMALACQWRSRPQHQKPTLHAGCSCRQAPLRRQFRRRLFPPRLDRVFDILHGRELDVPELAVHPFDPAHIDVVNDVARFRVDGHWPAP